MASAVHCRASWTNLVSVEGSPIRASLSSTSSSPPTGLQVFLTSPCEVLVNQLCRPCTASAQLAFPAISKVDKLHHQWCVLSNQCAGSWRCAAIAHILACAGSLARGSAGFVSMQHALAKDLSARLGINASRVQLRSVTPFALPSTRHLLAVSLSDAFQRCCPGYESHVSDT